MPKSAKRGRLYIASADQAEEHVRRQSSYYRPKRQRAEHMPEAATHNLWKPGIITNRPGVRNPTVAMLRQPKPVKPKRPQKTYGPKGAARLMRKHGVIFDETRKLGDRVPLSELPALLS